MNLEKANLSLSDSKINYENTSVDTNAGACFYSRHSRARARGSMPKADWRVRWKEKTAKEKEVEERRDGRKARSSGVRGTDPLSLYASLYATSSLSVLDSSHCSSRLLLSPRGRVVGKGRAPVKTHWHTYQSFPFLRFEYHKTWRFGLKAAQTAMQSRTEPVASQRL